MVSESFRQEAGEKLYIARDIEGEPTREEIKIVRNIEKSLSDNPDFIGLAINGSTLEGYTDNSSGQPSDIDLYVLRRNNETGERFGTLKDKVKSTCEQQTKATGKEIHLFDAPVSPEQTKDFLQAFYIDGHVGGLNGRPYFGKGSINDLIVLTQIITGHEADKYRKEIKEKIDEMTDVQKQKLADNAADTFATGDSWSLPKRMKRHPDLSEEEHRQIMQQRKEMWRNRFKKVWGMENVI